MLLWLREDKKTLPKRQLISWYILRAIVVISGTSLAYYAYQNLALSLATSISFTTPIFASFFAMFFFRERWDWFRVLALFIAFLGVLVVARFDGVHFNFFVILMIFSSALIACSILLIKRLTLHDRPRHIVFYSLLLMVPFSLIIALPFWKPMAWSHMIFVLLLGFFFSVQQISGARALMHADVVLVMGFDYLRLIFISALAYLFFSEGISWQTVIGSLIILTGALLALYRERYLRKIQLT